MRKRLLPLLLCLPVLALTLAAQAFALHKATRYRMYFSETDFAAFQTEFAAWQAEEENGLNPSFAGNVLSLREGDCSVLLREPEETAKPACTRIWLIFGGIYLLEGGLAVRLTTGKKERHKQKTPA